MLRWVLVFKALSPRGRNEGHGMYDSDMQDLLQARLSIDIEESVWSPDTAAQGEMSHACIGARPGTVGPELHQLETKDDC